MKTAIYIQDGAVQVVLTPEGEHEKNALSILEDKKLDVQIIAGSFYDCQGGWARYSSGNGDRSLILRVEGVKE